MAKTGRPSKYKHKYCDELIKHMKAGLSYESFAGLIGVNKTTLYEWEKKHEAFSNAKKQGESLSLLWWEKIGIAAMLGQPVSAPDGRTVSMKDFNATMWIFAMKNRHGWRDRHDVDLKAQITEPIVITTSTGIRTEMGVKK